DDRHRAGKRDREAQGGTAADAGEGKPAAGRCGSQAQGRAEPAGRRTSRHIGAVAGRECGAAGGIRDELADDALVLLAQPAPPGRRAREWHAPAEGGARRARGEIGASGAPRKNGGPPPAGMAGAGKLRAMVRIALTPTGALAREPLLIRASASAQGPRLVQTATRALQQCQPFSFLPADKYDDWKLLDLSFSPRGLAGG